MDTWGCAPRRSRSRRPAAMPRLRSPQQRSQRQPRGISHPAGEQPAGAPAGAAAAASPHAQSPGPRARPALTDAQQRCPEGETEPRVQQREPRHGGGAGRDGAERSGGHRAGRARARHLTRAGARERNRSARAERERRPRPRRARLLAARRAQPRGNYINQNATRPAPLAIGCPSPLRPAVKGDRPRSVRGGISGNGEGGAAFSLVGPAPQPGSGCSAWRAGPPAPRRHGNGLQQRRGGRAAAGAAPGGGAAGRPRRLLRDGPGRRLRAGRRVPQGERRRRRSGAGGRPCPAPHSLLPAGRPAVPGRAPGGRGGGGGADGGGDRGRDVRPGRHHVRQVGARVPELPGLGQRRWGAAGRRGAEPG